MAIKRSILIRAMNRLGFVSKAQASQAVAHARRSYTAAAIDRLKNDWAVSITSADTELRNDNWKLRARSRELERNNDYFRAYLNRTENNVVGPDGVQLHLKLQKPNGEFDTETNDKILKSWQKWGKKENCTVSGTQSLLDVQNLVVRSVARDAAFLIRKVEAPLNPFYFALQLIEIDHLDYFYSVPSFGPTGNEIRMGVELDKWRRPVAYHLWTRHPGDYYSPSGFKRERILAREILHIFRPFRAEQTTGDPWGVTAMTRLNMLGGYEEAELVAAREAACKGGFFIHENPEGYQGDDEDEQGNMISEMEPGTYEDLPMGTKFQPLDPQHPTQAFPNFIKSCLRGIASGLGISYNSLANDLEGVNYSSIRAGLLDERDEWKKIQNWFTTHCMEEIFKAWLPAAIMSGQLELSFTLVETILDNHEWEPRRWPWVDPLKDMQANDLAVSRGFRSRRSIIAEGGDTIENVFKEQEEDKKLEEKHNLNFSAEPKPEPGTLTQEPEPES